MKMPLQQVQRVENPSRWAWNFSLLIPWRHHLCHLLPPPLASAVRDPLEQLGMPFSRGDLLNQRQKQLSFQWFSQILENHLSHLLSVSFIMSESFKTVQFLHYLLSRPKIPPYILSIYLSVCLPLFQSWCETILGTAYFGASKLCINRK